MRCLVTGGAGFIGSNLVDALLERGAAVTVVDDLSTGRRENLDPALAAGAELVEADILDADAATALVERVSPEVVFHLAAHINVPGSVVRAAFDARVNIEGTLNMLEGARRAGVARFVNSSTGGAVYGEARSLPATEEHPVAPRAPYGQSKFAAEGYCDLFHRLHDLSTVSLRYGNVYGPRQDPHGETGVVAVFCGKLLAGERPTVVGDGRQTRDWIFVADVVAANLAAADSDATGPFNVGTGVESTVLGLIEILREHADSNFEPLYAPERVGDVRHIALDSSRAREQLGWECATALEEGIGQTLRALPGELRPGGSSQGPA